MHYCKNTNLFIWLILQELSMHISIGMFKLFFLRKYFTFLSVKIHRKHWEIYFFN